MPRHAISLAISGAIVLLCFAPDLRAPNSASGRYGDLVMTRGLHEAYTPVPAIAQSVGAIRREMKVISEARQEGRLLDAEKLLNAVIARASALRQKLGTRG
jgi:hypothetical protein